MKEWTYRLGLPLVVVALVPSLIGLHFYSSQNARICRNQKAVAGELVRELSAQLGASRKYLAAHPNGAPGIPADLIREGINRDIQTTVRLQKLSCR